MDRDDGTHPLNPVRGRALASEEKAKAAEPSLLGV
jgi:hypothetical protein